MSPDCLRAATRSEYLILAGKRRPDMALKRRMTIRRRAKLTAVQVAEMRSRLCAGEGMAHLARAYGVTAKTVYRQADADMARSRRVPGGLSCDLCERGAGLYLLNRTCCCLRLLRSTPRHGARKSMWLHLRFSLTAEQMDALRSAWKVEEPDTL